MSRLGRHAEADKLFRDSLKNDKQSDPMIWEIDYIYVPILITPKKNDDVFKVLDEMKTDRKISQLYAGTHQNGGKTGAETFPEYKITVLPGNQGPAEK